MDRSRAIGRRSPFRSSTKASSLGVSFGDRRIIALDVFDIRFPTSMARDGSDAMNPDPDYSAAYVILRTDGDDGLEGHGLTFTIGRGNELCVAAASALAPLVVGSSLNEI